jgi:uncharacterized membrane protein YphA (DoxX/SURF4 family)
MRVKAVATWALQILVGLMLILVGVMKFRDPSWVQNFARWGYPNGFYMVVGVLEAAGGVAVLIPSLASYGALLVMGIMCAASLTGLVHGEMKWVAPPIFYLVCCAAIAWLRRSNRWR